MTTLSDSHYNLGLNKSMGDLIHDTALISYGHGSKALTVLDKRQWDDVARETTQLAVERTVTVLYKLSVEANIPLQK